MTYSPKQAIKKAVRVYVVVTGRDGMYAVPVTKKDAAQLLPHAHDLDFEFQPDGSLHIDGAS